MINHLHLQSQAAEGGKVVIYNMNSQNNSFSQVPVSKSFRPCSLNFFLFCRSYHVLDDIDVVGDPAHLLTLLYVHPFWISSSQNRSVRVSLRQTVTANTLLSFLFTTTTVTGWKIILAFWHIDM